MDYIGSKLSLLPFIEQSIVSITNGEFSVFCDLFSGTSVVGAHFKKRGYQIISNDIQYYSFVLAKHYIGNNRHLEFNGIRDHVREDRLIVHTSVYDDVCDYLSNLDGVSGFIFDNYCPGGRSNTEYQRMYFTDFNGRLCDSIRQRIEKWRSANEITEKEYYYLLASLLESTDKFSNTASVYGAFLKQFKKSAARPLVVRPLEIIESEQVSSVYNQDSASLIDTISGDVLYLDPPYNQRQYAANYHILETIAKYDDPNVTGVTGMRDYTDTKSNWCVKRKVCDELDYLVQNSKFKYIFLSYNNEGLMSLSQIKDILSKRGHYRVFTKKYNRFKADSDANRTHRLDHTYEYLHCLIVEK